MSNCIIVLCGESFRMGSQFTRLKGTPESYAEQKAACESHVDFFKYIQDVHGINVKCIINTYETCYTQELKSWYDPYVMHTQVHSNLIGYDGLIRDSVSILNSYNAIDTNAFIMFIRIDLVLKPYFKEVFHLSTRILFSSICFTYNQFHKLSNGLPRVADLILYIPKRFFHLVKENKIYLYHSSFDHFINNEILKEDIGFFLNTYHDSDSEKDFNPIYKIANRKESRTWFDKGKIIQY